MSQLYLSLISHHRLRNGGIRNSQPIPKIADTNHVALMTPHTSESQSQYSRPSLIRIAWDLESFRLVKFSD
jgi:hypothetical protein